MSVNYAKLKTNLRLSMERLKLLEKKKTELAQKSRKEIADFIQMGKVERAKIRVEHIIREDYLVTAMEIVEMFCDLLLARFGMIEDMKVLDSGLEESIASLIWVAPRLQTDVKELKVVADIFAYKYGKPFAQACRENSLKNVSNKLMLNMGVTAPPKILVEQYLIEIAKSLNVHYEPDQEVLREHDKFSNNSSGGSGGSGGIHSGVDLGPPPEIGFFDPSLHPSPLIDLNQNVPIAPPQLPSKPPSAPFSDLQPPGFAFDSNTKNLEPSSTFSPQFPPNPTTESVPPSYDTVVNDSSKAPTFDSSKLPSPPNPILPDVPSDDLLNDPDPSHNEKFDDLMERFKNLKNRK